MPAGFILKKRDAFALKRLGHQHGWPVFGGVGLVEGGYDLFDIMAVNHQRVPTERGKTALIGFHVKVVHGPFALSHAVDINNAYEVVELIVRRHGRRFPDTAFCDLPVAQQDIDAIVELIQAFAVQRHANPNRESLPE